MALEKNENLRFPMIERNERGFTTEVVKKHRCLSLLKIVLVVVDVIEEHVEGLSMAVAFGREDVLLETAVRRDGVDVGGILTTEGADARALRRNREFYHGPL